MKEKGVYHRKSEKEHHDKHAASHKKETDRVKAHKKKSQELHEEAVTQWQAAKAIHDKHLEKEAKKHADAHEQWRINHASWESGDFSEGSEAPLEPEALVIPEYELAAPAPPLLPPDPEPFEPLVTYQVRKAEEHEEIETSDGPVLVLAGRYVVTDSVGNQFSVSEEELNRFFGEEKK
jgi:hypothetical protein